MPEYMKKITALEDLKSMTFRKEKTLTEKVTDYIPFVGSETDYNILPEVKRRANMEEIDNLKIVVKESEDKSTEIQEYLISKKRRETLVNYAKLSLALFITYALLWPRTFRGGKKTQ